MKIVKLELVMDFMKFIRISYPLPATARPDSYRDRDFRVVV